MTNKTIIIIIIIALIAVGGLGYYMMNSGQYQPAPENKNEVSKNNSENTPPAENTPEKKEFTVTGRNFSFIPSEIRVKQGETVKIIFDNVEGFHDFMISEFNIKTNQIQAPAKAEVEFVADKKGTFEYYCSVGQHRQFGMKGNLIVE